MPKRKRSEEVLSGSQPTVESSNTIQSSEEESVVGQPGGVGGVDTSGSPTAVAGTGRAEGVQSLDAAAEALLASSPFWRLLLDVGYTWW